MGKRLVLLVFVLFYFCCKLSAQQFSIYQGVTTANGLPSNYVLSVCEDENGFLWAGTDKGLCRYNGFNWQIWDKDNGLPGNYINRLLSDGRGGLWIDIGGKGYFNFNIHTATVKKLPTDFLISDYGVFSEKTLTNKLKEIYYIPNGKTATTQKIAVYKPDSLLNWFYDVGSKKIISLIRSPADSNRQKIFYKGGWNLIFRILPDAKRHRGIFLANDSLVVTNTHYYKYSTQGKLLKGYTLFKNDNNYSFSCLAKNGCYVSDNKTGYYFISNDGDIKFYNSNNGLGTNNVSQVYEMMDGTIAFATLGAGLQFIKNDYKKSYSTGFNPVRTIEKWGKEWYVLAGNSVYTINQSAFTLYKLGSDAAPAFHLLKTANSILISSLKGIHFYNNDFDIKQSLFFPFYAGISSILKTKNSYLASSYGSGILDFNNFSTNYTFISTDMKIIEKLLPLQKGYAALSYEEGLIITDTVQKTNIHLTKKDGLLSNSIQHIYEKQDTFWISSKLGINIFSKGKVIQTLSYKKGFYGSKAVYCFHDTMQQLWVVSDKYLHKYTNGKLQAITSHPIISDNNDLINTAYFDALSNTLATGSAKNISLISIDKIITDTSINSPQLFYTLLDNRLQKSAYFTVPYQFKNITFNFVSFAASPLSLGKLFYKLAGKEKSWNELKDSLSVSYSDLRPGNYKLIAKVVNADGYESIETLVASFIVKKPFWQSLWFFVLLFFATVLITIFAVKRVEAFKRRERNAQSLMQQTLQDERERISKDLHDHLGSNLVTMLAQVDNIETKLQKNAFVEAIGTVQLLSIHARELMNVLRETVWAVQENEHSLDDFLIRIRTFLQRFYENTGIVWQVKAEEDKSICLSPKQTLQLFRILQEASQNIIKHSNASQVIYEFTISKEILKVIITDNGIGLQTGLQEHLGTGLSNMTKRVQGLDGKISFENKIGTTINIEIPVLLKCF